MSDKSICLVCGVGNVEIKSDIAYYNVICKYCGEYTILKAELGDFDKNQLSSFLFYNGSNNIFSGSEGYCYLIGKEEPSQDFDYRKLTPSILETWYPQDFSEKIDTILLGLGKLSKYNGQEIELTWEKSLRLFFVDLVLDNRKSTDAVRYEQLSFIFEYMESTQNYFAGKIASSPNLAHPQPKPEGTPSKIKILPEGLKRIDELQKNRVNNKNVFIAIEFSERTKPIRKAIKQAIRDAGYIPMILDEHHHNNQIVPEMLYQIRQSKFVIAELTQRNNGAYYEAGYAAGLGKTVIYLCQQKADEDFGKDLHFDVRQINFVPWGESEDIVKHLCDRIRATIS